MRRPILWLTDCLSLVRVNGLASKVYRWALLGIADDRLTPIEGRALLRDAKPDGTTDLRVTFASIFQETEPGSSRQVSGSMSEPAHKCH